MRLADLEDHELDILETLVDGDTADFMQALELLELREDTAAAEEPIEQASLNTLSSDIPGKLLNSITNTVEQTELK